MSLILADKPFRKNTVNPTSKNAPNSSSKSPEPLVKSSSTLKLPSTSLTAAIASASSATTLASQANGSRGKGWEKSEEKWKGREGGREVERRMEREETGESVLFEGDVGATNSEEVVVEDRDYSELCSACSSSQLT